jgi:hypothetical protein
MTARPIREKKINVRLTGYEVPPVGCVSGTTDMLSQSNGGPQDVQHSSAQQGGLGQVGSSVQHGDVGYQTRRTGLGSGRAGARRTISLSTPTPASQPRPVPPFTFPPQPISPFASPSQPTPPFGSPASLPASPVTAAVQDILLTPPVHIQPLQQQSSQPANAPLHPHDQPPQSQQSTPSQSQTQPSQSQLSAQSQLQSQDRLPPDPQELPTLQEVHRTHIPTLIWIPKAARGDFSKELSDLYIRIHASPHSTTLWTLLMMFPRAILPAIRGPNHADTLSLGRKVKARLARWKRGDYRQLWTEAVKATKPKPSRKKSRPPQEWSQDEFNGRRATSLAHDGQYTKALQALCSSGLAQNNRETLKEMTSKHPTPPHQSTFQPQTDTPQLSR